MGEDLTGLSPEEIEALKDDESGDTEPKGDGEAENADSKDDSKAEGEVDSEAGQEDIEGKAVPGKKGDKPEIDDKDDLPKTDSKEGVDGDADGGEIDTKEQRPFAPTIYSADDERLKKLKDDLDDAKKKFDEGEIDFAKFSESKDSYNEAKWKTDFANEANANMVDERWKWEQDRFLDDNNRFRDNSTLNAAFVSAVNKIISSDEADKLSDREVLIQAKGQVEADIQALLSGMTPAATDDKAAKGDKKDKALKDAKKASGDRAQIPPDIKNAPAAAENTDGNEFAHIDKLDGEKYQAAVDKLTPEQLERYENG